MPEITITDKTLARLQPYARALVDTADDAINKVLDLVEENDKGARPPSRDGRDLVAIGGRIPHGTRLRATYKGKEYEAEVDDGALIWNGEAHSSPTDAAVAVIQSTGSTRNTENGWRFWGEYYDEEQGEWLPTSVLRKKTST